MSYLRKFAQKYFTNIEDENNVETEAQKSPSMSAPILHHLPHSV